MASNWGMKSDGIGKHEEYTIKVIVTPEQELILVISLLGNYFKGS